MAANNIHQLFREEVGWPEMVKTVADIRDTVSLEERSRLGILAGNYGEAGAINVYGPAYNLPRAISGIDSFWLWGYGDPPPETVIVLGLEPSFAMTLFETCAIAGKNVNPYGIQNEESRDHPDILLCRHLRQPWEQVQERISLFWLIGRRTLQRGYNRKITPQGDLRLSRTLRITAAALTLLLLAAGAYLWATAMIDSAFAFRSPLNAHAPTPGDPLGPPAVRRVVFVLVDALRYDTALDAEVMPALAELRSQGAAARMHSRPPSYSQAGWTVLLTGAWPEVNGGPAFNVDPEDLKPWVQDNLFTAAHRAGLQTAAAGFDWFEHMIPQETLSASFYTSGEDDAADRAVMAAALPWLDDPSLAFVLIHLDQVDYAGHHEGGPQGPNWNAAAGRVDGMLAEISAKLDYTQDILVIASDHGQVNAGGHGGHDAVTLLEPLVIAGAGVRPGEYADVQMVDLAPTLAALLGTNLPAAGQGRVLTEMIDLPSETLANLSSAHPAQQAGLYAQYATAIGRRIEPVESTGAGAYPLALEQIQNARRWAERWPRLPVAVLLILLPGAALYRLRARKTGRLVALALASTALYFILYRTIDDRVFSFSSVLGPTELVLYCALAAGLAFLIPWLVLSVRDRWFKLPPAAAAERTLGFALVTAWIAAIAPIISFAWNGPVVTWALPEPSTFFIGLLGQIQVLVTGAVGLLLTAVTALISRRNWDAEKHGTRGKNQDIENEAEGSLEPAD